MRSGKRIAPYVLLLLALCAGCARKRHPLPPPPQAEAPSLPTPAEMAAVVPPLPPLPAYSPRPVLLNTSVPPESSERASARHRVFRHHGKPESAGNRAPEAVPPATQPATNTQAASGPPSDVSPIGQLSTASGEGGPADREAIAKLIDSTEKGLDAIKHPLSAREQKTAAQIRTFLAHARNALKTNDLDGAQTLAVKAHLLLQELTAQ
jgi:hypothetical protein